MTSEFNEMARRLDGTRSLIAETRFYAETWGETRALARQIWNDECSRDMNRHHLEPVSRSWEDADRNLEVTCHDLQGVLDLLLLCQQRSETHRRHAEELSSLGPVFQDLEKQLESINDTIQISIRETNYLAQDVDEVLRCAARVAEDAGL